MSTESICLFALLQLLIGRANVQYKKNSRAVLNTWGEFEKPTEGRVRHIVEGLDGNNVLSARML